MSTFDPVRYAPLVHDLAEQTPSKSSKDWARDARNAPSLWHRDLYFAVAAKAAEVESSGIPLVPRPIKKAWRK